MTEIEIKHLQTDRRFSDVTIKNVYLLLYIPLGVIILSLRLILGILIWVLGNILPDVPAFRSGLSKLFCMLFGIVIHVEKSYNKKNVKVIISNQISPLDHLVIHSATDCVQPCTTGLYSPLSLSVGINDFGSISNLDEMKKSIGVFILNNTIPLLFQPETKVTNGKSLLKFKDWPFSFTNEVQPVFLKLHRPILDISVTRIGAGYWHDIFWYLFSPITVYNLCFLPVVEKGELTDTEFADKVRQDIATGLMVELCSHSALDILEWEKRYLLEQRRARIVQSPSTTAAQNNPEIHRMARQVKEVLPMVPYNVIFKDLARTKNVDVTITNILEGHVSYIPEPIPASSSVSATQTVTIPTAGTSTQVSGNDFCTAASSFPKSAQERMQSFQERKLQLIMNARKRYMDKHGLNALASNNC